MGSQRSARMGVGMPNRYVEHVVFGRLDMTQPDLGIAGGRLLLDRMLADDRLPVEARGLICAEDCMALGFIEPMYVYRRQGRVIASHQRGEAEQRHQPEITPEHHAWVDRAVRVAEAEGHRATEEKFTQDRKVRSDALIYGADGIRLGVESQVSPETPRKLKTRDNAARRNGVADAWQTPLHSLVELGVVPMLRTDALPAEIIKQPNRPIPFRSGVRHVDMVRCDERSPVPCPRRKAGGRCGRRHPRSRPKEHGFDQFIRDAAAGLLVRTTIRERRGLAFEFWTPLATTWPTWQPPPRTTTTSPTWPPLSRPLTRPWAAAYAFPWARATPHVEPGTPAPTPFSAAVCPRHTAAHARPPPCLRSHGDAVAPAEVSGPVAPRRGCTPAGGSVISTTRLATTGRLIDAQPDRYVMALRDHTERRSGPLCDNQNQTPRSPTTTWRNGTAWRPRR